MHDTADCDVAIVGGGLAGGLIALALQRAQPRIEVRLIEAGPSFGGNHRWSWFEGDLDPETAALLDMFPHKRWHGGYDVRFRGFTRHLGSDYRSLASTDFDAVLRRSLPQQAICCGQRANALDASGVTLENGTRLNAKTVIDCRDFTPSRHLRGGWQLFVGQHIHTLAPHDRSVPDIMDADIDQFGAYRFVYSLPLGPQDIFVEDTYYADQPALDRPELRRRVGAYCAKRGWEGSVESEEAGVLPVITGGDAQAHRREFSTPGVALAGARGLFVHPLTSYTLPFAAANAIAIARHAQLSGPGLARLIEDRARDHWRKTRFYRQLGKMLFSAAEPEERWRIFARFYRLPEPLIARFYAGDSLALDKLRLLTGKPPVPVLRGLSALLGKGAPLVKEDHT
ncbi:lycopene beta-cyclase CrtY [Qipengyuania sp.]|uniref:lycopene beta-cyclase CrtY n=1 Tax=Qipengyuania sp. TaxID=2004515 RepID=UPI0035C7E978